MKRWIDSTETGSTHNKAATIGGVDVGDAGDVAADGVAREDVLAEVAARALPERHDAPVLVGDLQLLDAVHVDAMLVGGAAEALPDNRRGEPAPRRHRRIRTAAAPADGGRRTAGLRKGPRQRR